MKIPPPPPSHAFITAKLIGLFFALSRSLTHCALFSCVCNLSNQKQTNKQKRNKIYDLLGGSILHLSGFDSFFGFSFQVSFSGPSCQDSLECTEYAWGKWWDFLTGEPSPKSNKFSEVFTAGSFRFRFIHIFSNRYIAKSGLESRPVRFSLTQHQRRPHLLHLIRKWLQNAPEKELEILPRMLRACRLTSMAEKLYKRLKVIEGQHPNCTLTHLFSFD